MNTYVHCIHKPKTLYFTHLPISNRGWIFIKFVPGVVSRTPYLAYMCQTFINRFRGFDSVRDRNSRFSIDCACL